MNEATTQIEPADAIRAACAALGITIRSDFVPFSQSRNAAEAHPSLNWRVTLERNGRDVLTTDYMAGSGHCPASSAKPPRAYDGAEKRWRVEAIARECETGKRAIWQGFAGGFSTSPRYATPIHPDAVSVIASLVMDASVLDAGGFEDWASEMGYDPDSRAAEAIYRACLEIALKMRAAIGDAGLEALRTACEGY